MAGGTNVFQDVSVLGGEQKKQLDGRGRDADQLVKKQNSSSSSSSSVPDLRYPKLTVSPSTPSLQVKSESARSPSFHSHMNNITRSAIIEIDDRYCRLRNVNRATTK